MGLGTPKNRDDYDELAVDGVTVFWPRGLDVTFPLSIGVNSLFGYKTLNLEGWKLI